MAIQSLRTGNAIIYGLIDPRSGRLYYVGRTKEGCLSERLCGHRQAARRNEKRPSARWTRGILQAGLEPEGFVIETVPESQWREAEEFWIAFLRGAGCDLANLTAGGDGLTGYKHSPEAIEKTASAHRGMKRSAETKARIAAAWTAERKAAHVEVCRQRVCTEEQRVKMSEQRKGRVLTAEHREKVGAYFRGRTLTDDHRAKVGAAVRSSWTPERRARQGRLMSEQRRAGVLAGGSTPQRQV